MAKGVKEDFANLKLDNSFTVPFPNIDIKDISEKYKQAILEGLDGIPKIEKQFEFDSADYLKQEEEIKRNIDTIETAKLRLVGELEQLGKFSGPEFDQISLAINQLTARWNFWTEQLGMIQVYNQSLAKRKDKDIRDEKEKI